MTPTADQSAAILAAKLRSQEPFSFWRFGDGFLQAATGHTGMTTDREQYTPDLRSALLDVWDGLLVSDHPNVYFGDWQCASFSGLSDPDRLADKWHAFFGSQQRFAPERFLHPEALLFMRESEALVDFWRAVKEDPRRKLYMGVVENGPAAHTLGADMISTPMGKIDAEKYAETLTSLPWDVLLFGAGLSGMIPVFRAWQKFPERTYIHAGSALDIFGRGRSRKQQIPADRARALMRGIL